MNRILCVFFIVLLAGCQQKSQENHYKEVIVEPPQANVSSNLVAPMSDQSLAINPHAGLDMPAMGSPFTWQVPDGWKQESGEGMRLASFHLISDAQAIDGSIVALGGMAGGLEANLRRWMGQIGLQASPDELGRLIAAAPGTKIKTGQEGKIFDFTNLQSKAKPTDKSMVVVMVTLDEETLFVKMTGALDSVQKNKEDFFKLAGSVEYHAPSGLPAPGAEMNPANPHAGLDMSQAAGFIEAPTTQNLLNWVNPQGWKQEAGKHMRMASFQQIAMPDAIDCYIIALAGPAGGLEANLGRWLGQLGLDASQNTINQLISSAQDIKTKDGLDIKVFDFTGLQAKAGPSDKSMMAAMISLESTTVFIKMTGSIGSVVQNKDNYLKLLGSVTRQK